MLPVIWKIPGLGIELPGFGLALMIGFLVSIWWAVRRAERSGANPDVVLNCGFIALAGGIIGARAMYVIHYWPQFANRGTFMAVAAAVIDVRKGGLEVYGGFILVVLGVLGYLLLWRHSIRWYLDIVAPSAALGMAIGRIGCFLNGCCWGGTCELPWAVRFPFGSGPAVQQWQDHVPGAGLPAELLVFSPRGILPEGGSAVPLPRESLRISDAEFQRAAEQEQAALAKAADLRKQADQATDPNTKQKLIGQAEAAVRASISSSEVRKVLGRSGMTLAELKALAHEHPSQPVHPTQLYSTITLGLLAFALNALYWRRTRDGQVIFTLLLIEPWTRWVLETLRADNPVDTLGQTISQRLAMGLMLVGFVGLIALCRLRPRSRYAKLWEPPPEAATAKA